MPKPIEQIWQRLLSRGRAAWPIYQRVDDTHPIDFYVGISSDGLRLLMLVSPSEPSQVPSYQAFEIIKGRRDDGRWTLTVELRRAEFSQIFGHLCDDLIAASRTECGPAEAAAYLVARIRRWQRLLGRDRSGLLDIQEIRGLIGELLFLQKVVFATKWLDAAVRTWEGPLDAPQDFRFDDRFSEIKTCGPSSIVVWISSAEQLDPSVMPIVLSLAVIEAADPLTLGTFTLARLVGQIRQFLASSVTALNSFNEKLELGGYVDRPEYNSDCFAFREFRYFCVSDGFPSLERRRLPDAITSVKYQLDLSDCRSFEQESFGI
jgi:hypothetical protein